MGFIVLVLAIAAYNIFDRWCDHREVMRCNKCAGEEDGDGEEDTLLKS